MIWLGVDAVAVVLEAGQQCCRGCRIRVDCDHYQLPRNGVKSGSALGSTAQRTLDAVLTNTIENG